MPETPSHLRAKAAEYLLRSDEERIDYIRSPKWVGYDGANEILDRLEALLEHPKSHRMAVLSPLGHRAHLIVGGLLMVSSSASVTDF